jgi:16S rRNA A1518/A1519 N6-dimethyltransferase RsmA/KsgA/DIM1 with predicted DNA glycosylase/AP lyase activity
VTSSPTRKSSCNAGASLVARGSKSCRDASDAAGTGVAVPRGAFRPVPGVDSSVVRITPHRPPRLSRTEEDDVRSLTRAAFGWRRKQLRRILRAAPEYALDSAGIEALERSTGIAFDARPETLAPEQFVALGRALRALGRPRADDEANRA